MRWLLGFLGLLLVVVGGAGAAYALVQWLSGGAPAWAPASLALLALGAVLYLAGGGGSEE